MVVDELLVAAHRDERFFKSLFRRDE